MQPTLDKTTEQIMEGQKWADPDIGGINDAFDKLFDPQNEASTPAVAQAAPAAAESTPSQLEANAAPSAPVAAQAEVQVDAIKFDDDFLESDVKPTEVKAEAKTGFDEEAFNKETEEAVSGMEVKAGEKFKALRNELKEAKQKTITPEVQQKLNDLELKASEAEGLRQQIAELSTQSAKIKVETSEEFNRKVKKPVDNLYDKSAKIAKMYEGDPEVLWDIISQQDRKKQNELIKEHLGEFSDFDKSEVYRISQDLSRLLDKRQEMLQDAEKYIEKIEADRVTQTEKMLEESRKVYQTHLNSLWNKYKETIPGLVDEDGKETQAYKNMRDKTMSLDFSKAGTRDMALASFSGVMVKHLAGEINSLRARLAEYEKGDEKAVRGRANVGGSVNATSAPVANTKSKSFIDRFAEADLV